jgi:hypothetical protein
MKTKSILLIVAAVILLSFTVVSKQSKEISQVETTQTTQSETAKGGFAMEDHNQW